METWRGTVFQMHAANLIKLGQGKSGSHFELVMVANKDVEAVIFQTLPLPHLSLPFPPTKNEKTTVDDFLNFCGSVPCLLLHFIILRRQKPSFIAITLPTSLELIISNYSVFVFLRYQNSC